MNLVEKMHEELVQDPELEKMKNLKGIDEEINKYLFREGKKKININVYVFFLKKRFQEKIKEAVENLQKQIVGKNETKLKNFDVINYLHNRGLKKHSFFYFYFKIEIY